MTWVFSDVSLSLLQASNVVTLAVLWLRHYRARLVSRVRDVKSERASVTSARTSPEIKEALSGWCGYRFRLFERERIEVSRPFRERTA
jgi:hypothetical protein